MPDWSTNPAMEDQFEDEYEVPLAVEEQEEQEEFRALFDDELKKDKEQHQKDYDRAMKGV